MIFQLIQSLAPSEIQSSTMQLIEIMNMFGADDHKLVSNLCWIVGYKSTAEAVSTWRVCILLYCIFRTGVVAVSRAAHVQDMWTPGHPVTSYIGCLLEKEHPEGDGMVMKTQAALSICQCT